MDVEVHVVDAFIIGETGGNAAGVVLDADHLTETQMQATATEMGLSETVFLSRSEKAGFKLDFFTPNLRTADCGHATVAAFSLLKALGRLPGDRSSKEIINGVRDIFVEGDAIYMEQKAPVFTPFPQHQQAIAASLNIGLDQFAAPAEAVDTGTRFLMVALKDEARVKAVIPDQNKILALSNELDLIGYYVFSKHGEGSEHQAGARMFGPRFAIDEESATGMAAGPCSCFLHQRLGLDKNIIQIEQGWLMDPPSRSLLTARLQVEDGRITSLKVGGVGRKRKTIRVVLNELA